MIKLHYEKNKVAEKTNNVGTSSVIEKKQNEANNNGYSKVVYGVSYTH
jgi:hypothetical protein